MNSTTRYTISPKDAYSSFFFFFVYFIIIVIFIIMNYVSSLDC